MYEPYSIFLVMPYNSSKIQAHHWLVAALLEESSQDELSQKITRFLPESYVLQQLSKKAMFASPIVPKLSNIPMLTGPCDKFVPKLSTISVFASHSDQLPANSIYFGPSHISELTDLNPTSELSFCSFAPELVYQEVSEIRSNDFFVSEDLLINGGHLSSHLQQKFEIRRLLGQGGQGAVLLCRNKLDQRDSAVKIASNFSGEKEIDNVAKLPKHDNLVRYYTWWKDSIPSGELYQLKVKMGIHGMNIPPGSNALNVICIQMELCGQDLRHWLHQLQSVDEKLSIGICLQLVQGLKHIHTHNLIHRDLKPDNIFFDKNNPTRVKIGDLGIATDHFATKSPLPHTMGAGTEGYLAPEQSLASYSTYQKKAVAQAQAVPMSSYVNYPKKYAANVCAHVNYPKKYATNVCAHVNYPKKYAANVCAHVNQQQNPCLPVAPMYQYVKYPSLPVGNVCAQVNYQQNQCVPAAPMYQYVNYQQNPCLPVGNVCAHVNYQQNPGVPAVPIYPYINYQQTYSTGFTQPGSGLVLEIVHEMK
ncbi:putative serine/threonine-protein kinase GCN2 [Folsomia candida]|uniref:non-specific serine/threonine protein kinase n=1 Tax=Folsomia candida TaxID=158441 RepID=A0A226DZX5_FOLCA|nr:putative serine/threonine-protein kinase GCN2 [Folsomia candida]